MGPENTYRSPTEGPSSPRSICSSTSFGATTVKVSACSFCPPPLSLVHPAAATTQAPTPIDLLISIGQRREQAYFFLLHSPALLRIMPSNKPPLMSHSLPKLCEQRGLLC